MKKTLLARLAVGFITIGLTAAAAASSTYYTSPVTWASAVSGVITDTYDSYGWSDPNGNLLNLGGSVALGGVTYSFPQDIFGVGPAVTYDAAYLTSSYLEWQSNPSQPLTITLPHAVTAVSFNYGEFYGEAGLMLGIVLGNGDATSVTTVTNSLAFLGIVSQTPFSTLTLNADRDFALIDNFSYASAIPEPTAAALLTLAVSAIMARKRK